MTRAEAIDLCKNLKLFMEINDKLYANKFLESYHVAISMATNALSEVSELQAINLDLASENENLLEQIQEMKAKTWIPVIERLPEEEPNTYWVCTHNGCQCECRWTNVNPFWSYETTDWHWNIADIPQYTEVTAWMQLPEPYKGE